MKIVDKLLVKSFFLPFIGAMFMALFVLVMQQVWVYLDDMAGKGAGFLLLTEMLIYMSASFLPLAFPIAVLLASVMVIGHLAEHYELSSLKSAGVSLARIMLPLMILAGIISVISFYCSDKLTPLANLQSKSRLYDIRNQKPTLSLEQGVFNNDFQGFSIRIGKKETDGTSIKEVLMYDQSQASNGKYSMVNAKRGQMFSTADERFFVMKLEDGNQFSEMKSTSTKEGKSYPFMRTSFKKWTKVFDLTEFQVDRTDTRLFESHYSMLSVRKLQVAIDSIEAKDKRRKNSLIYDVNRSYHHKNKVQQAKDEKRYEKKTKAIKDSLLRVHKFDSLKQAAKERLLAKSKLDPKFKISEEELLGRTPVDSLVSQQKKQSASKLKDVSRRAIIVQEIDSLGLGAHASIFTTFPNKNRKQLINKAKSFTRGLQGSISSVKRATDRFEDSLIDHVYVMHYKFSLAVACFIFVFIGAPMGAIIRKGGFGSSFFISIIFYVGFIMLGIFYKKLAKGGGFDPALAAWMPCLVLLPIGMFLTYRAMNDTKFLDIGKYFAFFKRLFAKLFQ